MHVVRLTQPHTFASALAIQLAHWVSEPRAKIDTRPAKLGLLKGVDGLASGRSMNTRIWNGEPTLCFLTSKVSFQ